MIPHTLPYHSIQEPYITPATNSAKCNPTPRRHAMPKFPHRTCSSPPASPQNLLTLQHLGLELDQEDRLARPHALGIPTSSLLLTNAMRRDALGRESRTVTHALDDAGDKGRAVEAAELAGQRNVLVDHGLVVEQHVLARVCAGALEGIGGAPEQVAVQRLGDELEEGQDARGADAGERVGGAREEEVEQADTEGIALRVQSTAS
jgi:hypothetical protein